MKILSTPDGPLSSGLAAREARGSGLGARDSGLARLSVIHDKTGIDALHIELSKAAVQYLNAINKGKPVDPRIPATIVQKHDEITKLQAAKPTEKDNEAPRRSLRLRRKPWRLSVLEFWILDCFQ